MTFFGKKKRNDQVIEFMSSMLSLRMFNFKLQSFNLKLAKKIGQLKKTIKLMKLNDIFAKLALNIAAILKLNIKLKIKKKLKPLNLIMKLFKDLFI